MFIVFSLIGALAEAVVLLLIVAGASGVVSQTDVDLSVGPITSTWELHTVLLTALAGTLLLVASRLIAGALSSRLAATVLDQVRRRLLADLLRASWARQATVTAARLQDLVSVQSMRIAGIVAQLSNFATALISFLALIGTAFLVDATTAGALAAVGVALAFAFRPFTQRLQAASFAHLDEAHRYIAFVADLGGVLPELRVYGVRQRAEALHGDASARVADAYRRMRLAAMIQPATYIGVVLLLLTGGLYLLSLRTEVDVTLAGAIVLVLLRGLRYSQTAQSAWQKAVELVPYLDDFSRVREDWYTDAGRRGERALEHVGAISLESVGYTYPSGDVGVRDIDLRIEPGQVVGLAGPSGAGKTTLAHIILGLRQPSSGTLRIDGVPSTEFDEASWFSRFAYVAQQPVLLNRDVRENVRFLRDQITDERITSSLSEAAMDRDLLEWIAGDQRLVGVGGSEVSGGQRQRIAIARALVDDPDVLVLDEPTSALDSDAERVVRNSLERLRGKLTVVLIAHRESTLEVCDVVVTLDEGRISSVTSQDGTRGNAGASAD